MKGRITLIAIVTAIAAILSVGLRATEAEESISLSEAYLSSKSAVYNTALSAPFSKGESAVFEEVNAETGDLRVNIGLFSYETSPYLRAEAVLEYSLENAKIDEAYVDALSENTNRKLYKNELTQSSAGVGFKWDLEYVEVNSDYGVEYVHLNSGVYEADHDKACGLKSYKLKDVKFKKNKSITEDGETSTYSLAYKDGTVCNFNENGLLTKKCDRYGNYVSYTWKSIGDFTRLEKISDSAGHEINITYTETKAIVESADLSYELVYSSLDEDYVGIGLLEKIKDGLGNTTKIEYGVKKFGYSFTSSKAKNFVDYYVIKDITYPTGLSISYEYTSGTKNLHTKGHMEYPKVKSRSEFTEESGVYDRKSYIYSGEPDGYPLYKSDELPAGYTYGTTVNDILGISLTNVYNREHLIRESGYTVSGIERQHTDYRYDTVTGFPAGEIRYTYDDSGEYTVFYTDYTYDENGNLTESASYADKEEKDERTVSYTYEDVYSLLLTQTYKTDSDTTVEVKYTLTDDGRNHKTSEVYVNGIKEKEESYTYNKNGSVSALEIYTDSDSIKRTEYTYKDNTVLPIETREKGDIGDIVTLYAYDEEDRLVKLTDPNGNITEYEYDIIGNLTSETNAEGVSVYYDYDISENVIIETRPGGAVIKYDYTADGSVDSIREEASGIVLASAEYDEYMRLVREYDAEGNFAEYEYDKDGRVSKVTLFDKAGKELLSSESEYDEANANGTLVKITDRAKGESIVTEYLSDLYGNLTERKEYAGTDVRTYAFEYDYAGNNICATLPSGKETVYTYDGFGNILSNTFGEIKSTYEYDRLGNVIRETNGEDESVYYEYDLFGRLEKVLTPYGENDYSETLYEYDNNGNTILETDPSGRSTSYTYDSLNRVVKITEGELEVINEYDDEGRVVRTITGNTESGYHEHTYEYDIFGRNISHTDPMGYSEYFTYNNLGSVVSSLDKNGDILYYEYDGMNRLTDVYSGDTGYTYTYDIRSNIKTVRDRRGNILNTYEYNGFGELTGETARGNKVGYTYDNDGNRISESLVSSGHEVFTQYYEYDKRNRLVGVYTPVGKESYSYDSADRLIGRINETNGTEHRYSYAKNGSIEEIEYISKGLNEGEILYTYDKAGRRTSETEYKYTQGITNTREYTYDSRGRLTKEIYNGSRTEYMYDVFGNTESVYEISNSSDIFYTRYTYDLNNRLETAYSLGEYTVYDYDRNGNMISRVGTGITDSFTYDIFGRLTSANVGNNRVEYEYDYRGLRAAKTVNNERTEYILSGDNVLAESKSGAYQYYYRGIGLIGYTDYNGNNYVYKKNAHGDISATVDMLGNTVYEYTYDAYGNEDTDYGMYRYGGKITPTLTDTNPYRYAGEYYDLETGFIYLRARYYDPTLGRFISEDPICDGINWYSYCAGDPVNFVDPSGHIPVETAFDLASASYSIWEFTHNPTLENLGYLAWDIFSLYAPYIPGSYVRPGYVDDLVDLTRYAPPPPKSSAFVRTAQTGAKLLQKERSIENYSRAGVWAMNAFNRGWEIERRLGGMMNNFPTIDKMVEVFNDGTRSILSSVTSIKSIDITAETYKDASKLKSRITKYIDDLAGFAGTTYKQHDYILQDNLQRILEIAIPPVTPNSAQSEVIDEMISYAQSQGIQIKIINIE